jgi:hypothetical protein
MADSAFLKIDRAAKHIEELNELVHQTRPFGYIIETNTETGQRSAFPTKNEAVIDAMALIIGDVVHNLRSALDHAAACWPPLKSVLSSLRSAWLSSTR